MTDRVERSLHDDDLDQVAGGATPAVDDQGIAWVSGKGGTRGVTGQYDFLLEVAGIAPTAK